MFTSTVQPQATTQESGYLSQIRAFSKRHKDFIEAYLYLSFLAGFALQNTQMEQKKIDYRNQANVRKDRLKEEMHYLKNGTASTDTDGSGIEEDVAGTQRKLDVERVREKLAWKRGLLTSKWANEDAQENRASPMQQNVYI